jgi:N-acetylglutamate synthase-like GNAT family acetyltransferase
MKENQVSTVVIRAGQVSDADAIHELIQSHEREGHLLPRTIEDVRRWASRFVVAAVDGVVKGCAELAPLSPKTAEVRSLVVARDIRHGGVAARLVEEIGDRAKAEGYAMLTAFTHDPRVFVRRNFSIVPHQWLPEKVAKDCSMCPLFRQCGQYAMVRPLIAVGRFEPIADERRMAVA